MAHYAQIDKSGIVTRVIVADQEFIDSGSVGDPSTWIQTDPDTYGGVHKGEGTPIRKNYAGAGYIYNKEKDAFVQPKPEKFQSFVLDEVSCQYKPPVTKPIPTNGEIYIWDEPSVSWKEKVGK